MAVNFAKVRRHRGDPQYLVERERELVRATVAARKTTLASNLITWALIAVACAMLPNRDQFVLPLVLRLLSMLVTIHLSRRLYRQIVGERPIARLMTMIISNLFVVGASWSLLIVPILGQSDRHPAHLIVACGVMIVVGSVMTTLSPLRAPFLAFSAGFFLPLMGKLMMGQTMIHLEVAAAFLSLALVMLAYTRAAGQQRIIAADTIIENRRLSQERLDMLKQAEYDALHDPLTGLYNRRALFGSKIIDPTDRRRKHVLLIDLDHFKQLNDSFGHEIGDRVLECTAQAFATVLATVPGSEHFAVRLGGEEFAVVLQISDPDVAHKVAEQVRFAVALIAGKIGLPKVRTTASIGLTHFDCGERIDDVFARADAAMYRAKSSGRNQVRRFAA